MRDHFVLKVAISLGAALVVVARLIWPDLKIDAVTFGLLVLAVLPWMTTLIESAKFPGGWEVKFRSVESAGQKVIQQPARVDTLDEAKGFDKQGFRFWAQDPNLALVALRIEIEKRIRALAAQAELNSDRSIARLLSQLQGKAILSESSLTGLEELIAAGNKAAHGASVEPDVAQWALEYGPTILATLDTTLHQLQGAG